MAYYVKWKNKNGKIAVSSFDSIVKARAKLVRLYISTYTSTGRDEIYDYAIYTDKACTSVDSFVIWKNRTLQTFTDTGRLIRHPFVWVHFNTVAVLNKDGTLTGEYISV